MPENHQYFRAVAKIEDGTGLEYSVIEMQDHTWVFPLTRAAPDPRPMPCLYVLESMVGNSKRFAEVVAEVLNENAHRFFASAEATAKKEPTDVAS